jgi:hypothetical protein
VPGCYSSQLVKSLFLALLLATAGRADIVFTNLSVPSPYGAGIVGAVFGGPFSFAEAFTPSANYLVVDAEAQLLNYPTSHSTVNFALFSTAGGLPGTDLGSLGTVALLPSQGGLFTSSGAPTPIHVQTGVEYWLVLTPGSTNTAVIWDNFGSSLQPSAFSPTSTGASGWLNLGTNNSQFQINGDPVAPEPASLALLGVGAGVVLLLRKRRALGFGRSQ